MIDTLKPYFLFLLASGIASAGRSIRRPSGFTDAPGTNEQKPPLSAASELVTVSPLSNSLSREDAG